MRNPWLDIPEADYVGHMSSPAVGQGAVLGRLFGEALASVRPAVVLVLGCSTGNGLEHVDPAVTSRVVAVDVNPMYLTRLQARLPNPRFELDIRCGDVSEIVLERETYGLVHAGLLFEYVDWFGLLPHLALALAPGGVLSVVLQVPSASTPAVTPTAFTSLRALESLFRFVEPAALADAAAGEGLSLKLRRTEALPAGKSFEVLHFVKALAGCGRSSGSGDSW